MPGPNQPVLNPGFVGPATPFRPVDVLGSVFRAPALLTSLPLGFSWFVRVGGSNDNGGSDTSLAALRTGTDGVVNATTTFTSASANFTGADVGRGICINTGAAARHHRIVSVSNSTTVILDRVAAQSASGRTWAIGGAWADLRAPMGDAAANTDLNSPVASGDVVWVGAGTYRAIIVAGGNWSPANGGAVGIIGDVYGVNTGDAGLIVQTAYLTNDKTAPSGSNVVSLNGGTVNRNVAFQSINFIGGANTVVSAANGVHDISFTDCSFTVGSTGPFSVGAFGALYDSPANWTFNRCRFFAGSASAFNISAVLGSGADYDINVLFENCLIFRASTAIFVNATASGTGAGKGGGIRFKNCASVGGGTLLNHNSANTSTNIPSVVTGCWVHCPGSAPLAATTLGQIVEDYNVFVTATARTNVTAGAHSVSDGSYAPMIHFGQELAAGMIPRPFGEPMAGSPLLAFGSPDTGAGLLDLRQGPRPSTSARWALGAYQRGNTFGQETVLVHTGANAVSVIGSGWQDFDLAVDAGPLTVSVFCQYDANYVGPKPQLQIVDGNQVGVPPVQVNFTGAASGAWEQQSITINPTGKGIVTVRLISGDDSGISKVVFDTFAVA